MSHLGNVLKASQRESEQMIESAQFESRFPSREAAGRLARHGASVAYKMPQPCDSTPDRPIDRVFSAEEGPLVVFRRNDYKTSGGPDLSRPFLHHLMFVRRAARHGRAWADRRKASGSLADREAGLQSLFAHAIAEESIASVLQETGSDVCCRRSLKWSSWFFAP
jgi:hypothetical protein